MCVHVRIHEHVYVLFSHVHVHVYVRIIGQDLRCNTVGNIKTSVDMFGHVYVWVCLGLTGPGACAYAILYSRKFE